RMSMRPQRSSAALATASQSAALTILACTANPLPPSFSIIAAVASARSRMRSTQSTSAPSRANSNAMARPLPIVSPGVWPAPETIAALPSRRPATSEPLQVGIEGLALVELHAEAVQHHRDLGVLAGREHHVHPLLLVEVPGQGRPGGVGDELVVV